MFLHGFRFRGYFCNYLSNILPSWKPFLLWGSFLGLVFLDILVLFHFFSSKVVFVFFFFLMKKESCFVSVEKQ